MNTADKINWLREHGYRQMDIAEETGLSQSILSRISSGVITDPRSSTAYAIDEFFARVQKTKGRKKHA